MTPEQFDCLDLTVAEDRAIAGDALMERGWPRMDFRLSAIWLVCPDPQLHELACRYASAVGILWLPLHPDAGRLLSDALASKRRWILDPGRDLRASRSIINAARREYEDEISHSVSLALEALKNALGETAADAAAFSARAASNAIGFAVTEALDDGQWGTLPEPVRAAARLAADHEDTAPGYWAAFAARQVWRNGQIRATLRYLLCEARP